MTVSVLVPTRGRPSIHWMTNMLSMAPPAAGWRILTEKNLPIDLSRNKLAEFALQDAATDRVFFLADDVLLPPHGLNRLIEIQDHLMAQGQGQGGIVSGVYYVKARTSKGKLLNAYADASLHKDYDPKVAQREPGDPVFGVLEKLEPDTDVLMLDGVGAGCLLIHRSILEKLSKPWFSFNSGTDRFPAIGEDLFFAWKAKRELGVSVALVQDVRCGHLCEALLDGEGNLVMPEEGAFGSQYRELWGPHP